MIFIKKIVCLINDYKNSFGLELFCFDCKFTSIELLKRVYYNVDDDNTTIVKEEINEILTSLEFKKASCAVGINSPVIFTESIKIPKLSINEENKACMLKLEKTYKDDFDKQYVFVKDKINVNKNTRRVNYLLVQKDKYKKLLNKIEFFGLNIDKVVFSPVALAQFVGKKHIISGDKVGLYINIDKTNAIIVVTKGAHLVEYKITNLGLYPIYDCIAKFHKRDPNEVVSNPFGENSPEVEIMVKEYFQSVINDVKKISYLNDFTINELYLHSEFSLNDFIKAQFEKRLKLQFKVNIKLDDTISECFQAFSVLKCNLQTLPVRMK